MLKLLIQGRLKSCKEQNSPYIPILKLKLLTCVTITYEIETNLTMNLLTMIILNVQIRQINKQYIINGIP
jgi:hypothetical protein